MTAPGIDTTTQPDPVIVDDGDHDRFAHYVKKDDIMKSAVDGVAVIALCGKVWIPNRDPERFPVCPTCDEIMKRLKGRKSN